MKLLIASSMITLLLTATSSYAAHDLEKITKEQIPVDQHISWHEFRHELGAYVSVRASMDHNGVITLAGHTDSSVEKSRLNALARQVRGATEVSNLIGTD